jgi:hypothetical protein
MMNLRLRREDGRRCAATTGLEKDDGRRGGQHPAIEAGEDLHSAGRRRGKRRRPPSCTGCDSRTTATSGDQIIREPKNIINDEDGRRTKTTTTTTGHSGPQQRRWSTNKNDGMREMRDDGNHDDLLFMAAAVRGPGEQRQTALPTDESKSNRP